MRNIYGNSLSGFCEAKISEKDLADEDVQRKSKEGAVFELLRKKKISQGRAAELLGITRNELFDLMAKFDIPVIDMGEEELKKELAKNFERGKRDGLN